MIFNKMRERTRGRELVVSCSIRDFLTGLSRVITGNHLLIAFTFTLPLCGSAELSCISHNREMIITVITPRTCKGWTNGLIVGIWHRKCGVLLPSPPGAYFSIFMSHILKFLWPRRQSIKRVPVSHVMGNLGSLARNWPAEIRPSRYKRVIGGIWVD